MKTLKTPNGTEIDVEAIAAGTPEEALLLLSEHAQTQVGELTIAARREVCELILTLADTIAKIMTEPTVLIEVADDAQGNPVVTVELEGLNVCRERVKSPMTGVVMGLAGMWEHLCKLEPHNRTKNLISLQLLVALSDLSRTLTHTIASRHT